MKILTALQPALFAALSVAFAPSVVSAQQICQPVADGIRAGTSALHAAPAERLTQKELLDRAHGALRASPRLIQALGERTQFAGSADLYRFGQSALQAAVTVEGSAGCQFFAFFATKPDGTADTVEPPSVLRDRPEGTMMPCSGTGSLARIGEIAGQPAFVIEDGADQDETTTVTPWRDGAWQKACTVAVHYNATFTVTNRYCKGVDCVKLGDLARALAIKFDRAPDSLPQATVSSPELTGPAELPTFREGIDHDTFAEDSPAISVTFEGQPYVARIGHRAIGWRRFPDYLFALYRQDGDKLETVAGIVIEKKRDKPADITIK